MATTYEKKKSIAGYQKKSIGKKLKPTLIKKLDNIFSKFIRLRDSDSNGYCRCISCGSIHFWKNIHNGHFVNRQHIATRFNEKNCNAQCVKCNTFDEGNNIGYMKGLIKKYGQGIIDELYILKKSSSKLSDFELNILIDHYKKEVDKLLKEKGFK